MFATVLFFRFVFSSLSSCDRPQIGQSPTTAEVSARTDSESYSLSAGLALGLVTLGCGREQRGESLADLELAAQLQRYVVGVSDSSGVLVGRKDGGGPQTRPAPTGGHVHRTGTINIAVTAPGAILALAMMYLKSNDDEVVKQLAVPETLFLLDYVRPDLLLLRVLCRSLVMWDSVQPTAEWIESHVPLMLRACMERLRHAAPPLPNTHTHTHTHHTSAWLRNSTTAPHPPYTCPDTHTPPPPTRPTQFGRCDEVVKAKHKLVATCNVLGCVALAGGGAVKVKEAFKLLSKAKSHTRRAEFFKDDHSRLQLRATTLNNLGCLCKQVGKLDKALQYLREVRSLWVIFSKKSYLWCSVLTRLICTLRHGKFPRNAET